MNRHFLSHDVWHVLYLVPLYDDILFKGQAAAHLRLKEAGTRIPADMITCCET